MSKVIAILRRRASRRRRVGVHILLIVAALFVAATSYIHWHLWDALGYRHVAIIGGLFLAQAISGLLIAIALILIRELWIVIVGLGFVASTLTGFIVSVTHGFFGFRDSWLAPYAKVAFVAEVATLVTLLVATSLIALEARSKS
jgi:hypothetical protein